MRITEACSGEGTAPQESRRKGRPLARALPCVLVCLLVSGCMTQLVYKNLNWLVVWYMNGVYSLSKAQRVDLRAQVDQDFEWHRQTQLPRYAAYLLAIEQQAKQPVSDAQVEAFHLEGQDLWRDSMHHIIPGVAVFLRQLSPEQVDRAGERMDERDTKQWKEFTSQSPAERVEKRDRMIVKAIQHFTGRLTKEQEALVIGYASDMHEVSMEWMESRRQWRIRFQALLQDRPEQVEYEARLRDLFIDPNRRDDPPYRRKVEENLSISFSMLAALTNDLTEKQRAKLSKQLTGYAADFERLTANR